MIFVEIISISHQEDVNLNIKKGDQVIFRSCITLENFQDFKGVGKDECKPGSFAKITGELCTCSTDLCNNSSSVSVNFSNVTLIFCIALFLCYKIL